MVREFGAGYPTTGALALTGTGNGRMWVLPSPAISRWQPIEVRGD